MDLLDSELTQKCIKNIGQFCMEHEYHMAVAESVTSGTLQLMLSSGEKAGLFFSGGITMYSCCQKNNILSIPLEECNACTGVSMEIAEKLALQICRKFKCELGLAVTGFATPLPEKGVYDLYAIGSFCLNGEIVFTEKLETENKDQLDVQKDYASSLIILCSERLNAISNSS
jgi:nicotinamide-nucleotide amidase